ncbi:CAP domain-containing protein [Kibdelosporangium phytohabitans]|nr:CAP domain-containing protein [Kibdelosporangium phytohabitans]MBE1463491.1 uncharacterized protein YkwD [Kibdelosporangium phytohabitans]
MAMSAVRDSVRIQIENKVVSLVNAERAKRDLGRLRIDERLRRCARGHSADMAERDYFAHQGPRGLSPLERMLAAGVEEPAGENIACGQETPAQVVHAWMQSIPHRRNILHKDFGTIGVGLHVSGGVPWWTQNFGY